MAIRKDNWNNYFRPHPSNPRPFGPPLSYTQNDSLASEGRKYKFFNAPVNYTNPSSNTNEVQTNQDNKMSAQENINKNNFHKIRKKLSDYKKDNGNFTNKPPIPVNTWTDQFWVKPNGGPKGAQRNPRGELARCNMGIVKFFNQLHSTSVQINKGKSLLEKMGWRGGGLGRNGHGIAIPIVPSVVYAAQTFGLGHLAKSKAARKERGRILREQQAQKKKMQLLEANLISETDLAIGHVFTFDYYRNNLLLRILDFVRDSSKIGFKIDVKLTNKERREIHMLVESFVECNMTEYNEKDRQVVEKIMAHNHYVLVTKSDGSKARRRLTIIKMAPQNVYLITPHILRKADEDKDDEEARSDEDDDDIGEECEANIKEERNEDFKNLNAINLNRIKIEVKEEPVDDVEIKDDCVENRVDVKKENDTDSKQMPDLDETNNLDGENEGTLIDSEEEKEMYLLKLIDCFHDFVDKSMYKEFRFLGDFNSHESDAIKLFLNICLKKSGFDEKPNLLSVLKHEVLTFNVVEDSNGDLFIHKQETEDLSDKSDE